MILGAYNKIFWKNGVLPLYYYDCAESDVKQYSHTRILDIAS